MQDPNVLSQSPSAGVLAGEKRAHPRVESSGTFSYRIKKVVGQYSGQPEGEATMVNISDGGLQFHTDRVFGRGSIITVTTNTESLGFPTSKVRIVRTDKLHNGYCIAAEFI